MRETPHISDPRSLDLSYGEVWEVWARRKVGHQRQHRPVAFVYTRATVNTIAVLHVYHVYHVRSSMYTMYYYT